LPATKAAFAAGEISYSKVRAITRVADPRLDGNFVDLARNATASQLERIVRECRNADPDEQAKALGRRKQRFLRHHIDSEGMVVIHARLSPEDGAIVLAALEAARQAMTETAESDVPAETLELAEQYDAPAPAVDDWAAENADALLEICASVLSTGLTTDVQEPRVSVLVHVDEAVLAVPAAPSCAHLDDLGAITGHMAMRFACEGAVSRLLYRQDGTVEQVGATRSIPPAMRRALLARDDGCRFPGCCAKRFLHAHHVVFASQGGRTCMSNLVTLCSRHHRLIHEGGWRLTLESFGRVRVYSPKGRELPPVVPAETASGELAASQDALAYGGERFSLSYTIDGLLSTVGKNFER
jgi:hypothetical protein